MVPVKLVVLKNYFDQLSNLHVCNLFNQIMHTKKLGYENVHDKRFLPVSTHDFFSTHLVLCHAFSMEPILVAKIVDYHECKFYRVDFPIEELKSLLGDEIYTSIEKLTDSCIKSNKKISYIGGLTINPKYKGHGFTNILKDMYAAVNYYAHITYNYGLMFALVIPGSGSGQMLEQWGNRVLKVNGKNMEPVSIPFANNVKAILSWSNLRKRSLKHNENIKQYHYLWNEKIDFVAGGTIQEKKLLLSA